MNHQLVIGLDFGSDSVRGILADCITGEILSEEERFYPRWGEGRFCAPDKNQFRQHPQDYLDCLISLIPALVRDFPVSQITGIGVDTTGSTVCALDRNGTPLAMLPEFAEDPDAMFYLWKDHSSIAEADLINQTAENWRQDFRRYSGGHYSSEWFWSKAVHILKNSPKAAAAAFSFAEHCDWMTAELTGNTDPLTMKRSRCAAGHKAMWHESWNGLPSAEFLDAVLPGLGRFREHFSQDTSTSDRPCGTLSEKWAGLLGLHTGVTVACGQLDCHAGAVGAGIRPGKLIKVVGTSTCDILVDEPSDAVVSGICGQVDGSVLPDLIGFEAGQAAFGDVYRWFENFMSAAGRKITVREIEEQAAQLPADEDVNLIALDWLNGRRSPDADEHLRGAVLGLNLGTSPAQVYRALVEATCCGARRIMDRFAENGCRVESITAVGGIARKSSFVMQNLADIMNRSIGILDSTQACALGSAMNAAVASGVFPEPAAASAVLTPACSKIYQPRTELSGRSERLYRRYLRAARLMEEFIRED